MLRPPAENVRREGEPGDLLLAVAPGENAGFGAAIDFIRPDIEPGGSLRDIAQGSIPPAERIMLTGGGVSRWSRRFRNAGLLINA